MYFNCVLDLYKNISSEKNAESQKFIVSEAAGQETVGRHFTTKEVVKIKSQGGN